MGQEVANFVVSEARKNLHMPHNQVCASGKALWPALELSRHLEASMQAC
jgi:hypothetical protein